VAVLAAVVQVVLHQAVVVEQLAKATLVALHQVPAVTIAAVVVAAVALLVHSVMGMERVLVVLELHHLFQALLWLMLAVVVALNT
jgi:hypothetical protein